MPGSRYSHIAACLGYGGEHQRLLISGGIGGGTLDDMWLLDPQSGRMEEVRTELINLYSSGQNRVPTAELRSRLIVVL